MGKIEGDDCGSRYVMEAQLKMLSCLKFCSAMKNGLDDENWKPFITVCNKKSKNYQNL